MMRMMRMDDWNKKLYVCTAIDTHDLYSLAESRDRQTDRRTDSTSSFCSFKLMDPRSSFFDRGEECCGYYLSKYTIQ